MKTVLRWKRMVSILICFALITTLVCVNGEVVNAATEKYTKDGMWKYRVVNNEIHICRYLGDDINVVIPEMIENLPVKWVDGGSFGGLDRGLDIESVRGNSVIVLDGQAFLNCKKLTSVDFPMVQRLTTAVSNAAYYGVFYGCSSLEVISLPSLTEIGKCAFSEMTALKAIYTPKLEDMTKATFTNDPWYYSSARSPKNFHLPLIERIYIPCTLYNEKVKEEGVEEYASWSAIKPIHAGDWVITTPATCSSAGEKERVCVICQKTEIETLPKESHKFSTYKYNNDAQIGIDGTETATCDFGCGTTDTRTKVGSALSSGGSSGGIGGGSYLPPASETQKPTITENSSADVILGSDGTTATIKVKDGYELVDVLINGVSKGAVTALSGLKTGDIIEIKTKLKEVKPTVEQVQIELGKVTADNFKARSKQVKLKSGRKAIKITWSNTSGVAFDGVEIFRSTKKNSGYGKKPFFTSKSGKFYNTSIKKGRRYYYKVRGYIELDGVKYYSGWSKKAWRTVK